MKMIQRAAIAITVAALGAGSAAAQITQTQPAEFPPASFKGKQYVDSLGCVFIRAGIDGNVSWVPRVTRARKAVCGFKPTNGVQSAAAAAAPAAIATAPAAQVEQITVDVPAAAPAGVTQVAAAKPRPTIVRQTAPKPVRRVAQKRAVQKVAPAPARAVQTAPAPAVRQTAGIQSVCPGASPLGQRYLPKDDTGAVRCGPQAGRIVARNGGTAVPLTAGVSDHARIVPKHVAINRINTTNVTVPRGYRHVWEDGRLNPKRAEQSLSGRGHMLLVWTNTVPRRLINHSTGRDVTASVPLVYPYLDVAEQTRELGEVTIVQRDGQLVKRIVRHGHATSKIRAQAQPVLSSRSTPKPQAAAAAPKPRVAKTRVAKRSKAVTGGTGYVQIGLFSTDAKARRAAQHLSGMGMGARIGKTRYKGKSYLSVQAGPFNGTRATQGAVSRLKSVGYTGARIK